MKAQKITVQSVQGATEQGLEGLLTKAFKNVKSCTRTYGKKQILFYEDTSAASIYVIHSGRVKLYKVTSDGKQHILRIAGPGEVIALEAILTGDRHQTTAEMIEAGSVSSIDRAAVLKMLQANPALSMQVMRMLAAEVSAGSAERLDLARSSVRERMARLLATLSRKHGISDKRGIRIDLKLSREEMAEMIGTAAETAMRLLKDFREERLVEVNGRDILVLDCDRLDQTANIAA